MRWRRPPPPPQPAHSGGERQPRRRRGDGLGARRSWCSTSRHRCSTPKAPTTCSPLVGRLNTTSAPPWSWPSTGSSGPARSLTGPRCSPAVGSSGPDRPAVLTDYDGAPTVTHLGRLLGWDPPPLTVREARGWPAACRRSAP